MSKYFDYATRIHQHDIPSGADFLDPPGTRVEIRIPANSSLRELERKIYLTDTCTITIHELAFETNASAFGHGECWTTMREIIEAIRKRETGKNGKLTKELYLVLCGFLPITVTFDDSIGDVHIEPVDSDRKSDPNLKITRYCQSYN